MPTPSEIEAILQTLESAPAIIVPMVGEIPEAQRRLRPGAEKWSAHEHACHLAEVHGLFFERLDVFLGADEPVIEAYFPPTAHEQGALLERDVDTELERFTSDRGRFVARLRALTPADWNRTAEHPEYSHYSLFILLRHIAMHDHLHAYRIEEILLAPAP